MKKLILLLFLLTIFIFPFGVKALSVDKNNLVLEKGQNEIIGLYANVNEEVSKVELTFVYSTYDIPARFVVNPMYTDNNPSSIKHVITLDKPTSGQIHLGNIEVSVVDNPKDRAGSVNISRAKAMNDVNTIALNSQVINVGITDQAVIKTPEVDDFNYLKSIDSNVVKIKLIKEKFDYEVSVDSKLEELDLKPIAIDDTYKVDITNQKINELVDNKIVITVTSSDGKVQTYNIKVNKVEKEIITDNKEEVTKPYKYKGKWVTLIVISTVILALSFIIKFKIEK